MQTQLQFYISTQLSKAKENMPFFNNWCLLLKECYKLLLYDIIQVHIYIDLQIRKNATDNIGRK